MRHSAGHEWEERLNEELAAAGVAFWTENQLRSRGYHKTPDARLQACAHACACAGPWQANARVPGDRSRTTDASLTETACGHPHIWGLSVRWRHRAAPAHLLPCLTQHVCVCGLSGWPQVPIAVQGRIVNWIDSKATFGDDKLHRWGGLAAWGAGRRHLG